jgi:hypothetical protein
MSKAAAALDETELATIRTAAFDGFPSPDVFNRSPDLANAYMFASFDVARIAGDTKDEAVADGRARYAAEIRSVDCDEQFARLGERFIDSAFAPLFDEVRLFYLSRLGGETDSQSRESALGGRP